MTRDRIVGTSLTCSTFKHNTDRSRLGAFDSPYIADKNSASGIDD